MSGSVLVRGQVETKPGTMLDPGVEIALKEEDHPYVSRGALKLVKGLDTFAIDPAGKVALDIGASTGSPARFSTVTVLPGSTRYCFPPVWITAYMTWLRAKNAFTNRGLYGSAAVRQGFVRGRRIDQWIRSDRAWELLSVEAGPGPVWRGNAGR